MRIDQLKYLVVLGESTSIIKASEKLHISHQVLGTFLKKAEEEFNTEIFKRSKNGISVTEKGAKIIDFACETLKKYNDLFIEEDKRQENIQISLYATLIYSISLLPDIVKRFPYVSSYVQNTMNIINEICYQNHWANSIGLINFRQKNASEIFDIFHNNHLVYKELFTSEICYFVRNDSELAKNKTLSDRQIPNDALVYLTPFDEYSQDDAWHSLEKYNSTTDSFDIWLDNILYEDKIGMLYDLALVRQSLLHKYLPSLSILRGKEPMIGRFGIIYHSQANEESRLLAEKIAEVIHKLRI